MKAVTNIKFTYQDYLLLPEDKRYEIIEGELIIVPSPGFTHQSISGNLGFLLRRFIREKKLGIILNAPMDVVLSEENVVQPDILFISKKRASIITEKNIQGAPDLVIEILSPNTKKKDSILKRKLYAKFGVKEFWLVDPEKKEIEVLTFKKEGFERTGLYHQDEVLISPLLPGLKIPLREVF
ncbi:Uma2 family endonuclease [Candidatus Aerophobetes bacterium]|uniref:Uma2 family endonuclease n=1 Tax=Aerophobetes bacterium TaxID=2030807 RepID=A0A662DI40_UNCAE|nr:MAG: Uma2 family endonuclease [Candidatus Aerophobetes bacterium]